MSCVPCEKRKEKLKGWARDAENWFQESKISEFKTLLAVGALVVSIIALASRKSK